MLLIGVPRLAPLCVRLRDEVPLRVVPKLAEHNFFVAGRIVHLNRNDASPPASEYDAALLAVDERRQVSALVPKLDAVAIRVGDMIEGDDPPRGVLFRKDLLHERREEGDVSIGVMLQDEAALAVYGLPPGVDR